MTANSLPGLGHNHFFLGNDHQRNERKVWLVIALTAVMMLAEIIASTVYGSMALVADGWHMSTHAGAMLIAVLAYRFARKHAGNPRGLGANRCPDHGSACLAGRAWPFCCHCLAGCTPTANACRLQGATCTHP